MELFSVSGGDGLRFSPVFTSQPSAFPLPGNKITQKPFTMPGAWDRKAGTYTVTEASRAAVQTFLNVSPTEEQASSASEP